MNRLFKILNSRIFNLFFPLADFLHIYQLEEYDNESFLLWSIPRLYKRNFQRVGAIIWTQKAKVLYLLSMFFIIFLTAIIALYNHKLQIFFFLILVNTFLTPFWLVISDMAIWPLEAFLKSRQISAAKKKLSKISNLKVVAISGSVGKTTTRYFVTELLKTKYKTFTTFGNINTSLGIASEINTKMPDDLEIFVVELGEYRPGDLVKIAKLVSPEILIYTKIGSQHLEKFGSQNTINNEFLSLKSFDSVMKIFVAKDNLIASDLIKDNRVVKVDMKLYQKIKSVKKTNLLKSKSFWENLNLAISVAEYLAISKVLIEKIVPGLSPLKQRLDTTVRNGVTIIDDSYNISSESAENALEFLSSFKGKKVLVTGGIVDQGEKSEEVNEEFGFKLAKVADVVVLAKNNFYKDVITGIKKANTNIEVFESKNPMQTPQLLSGIIKSGDVVLVQNELPEVYWH